MNGMRPGVRTKPVSHNTQYREVLATYEFISRSMNGGRMLDAACGYGYGAARLADAADAVIGIDFEREALAWGKARYRKPNLRYVAADLHNLCFSDGSFDGVCLLETIHFIKDYWRVIYEVSRVLKPGGHLYVSTRRAIDDGTEADSAHLHPFTVEMMENILTRSGFEIVDIYGLARPEATYSLEERLRPVRGIVPAWLRRVMPARLISAFVYLLAKASRITPPQELGADSFVIAKDISETGRGILMVCKKSSMVKG